jgi:hypothetical protein
LGVAPVQLVAIQLDPESCPDTQEYVTWGGVVVGDVTVCAIENDPVATILDEDPKLDSTKLAPMGEHVCPVTRSTMMV